MENKKIEGNKLIAEFMGLHFHKIGWVDQYHIDGNYECKELKYHFSWNWIMPVVEKIRKLGYPVDIKINGGANDVSIYIGVGVKPIGIYESDTKADLLKCAFESVIEFINWYNTQPHE